jgi:hypothetical protein
MDDVHLLPLEGIRPNTRGTDVDTLIEHRKEEINGLTFSGSSSGGTGWSFDRVSEEKPMKSYWGSGDYHYDVERPIPLPLGYAVMTFWDNEPAELFTFTDAGTTAEVLT